MAFLDDEKSVSDSSPVELYTFTTNAGVFRRTSLNVNHVHGGNTFTAIPITRSQVEGSTTDQAQELRITLPLSDVIVRNSLPVLPSTFTFLLQRKQLVSGEVETLWDGVVVSIQVTGRDATLLVPSVMDAALGSNVPSAYFQPKCNHSLYDTRCQMQRVNFDLATTITAVSGLTVTVASVGGNPDNWFTAGDVLRAADNDRRLIKSQVGTTLTLSMPFPPTVALPASVTLFAGCDLSMRTCVDKFANGVNFGGHPYISVQFVALTRLRELIK
jgi:hypothetical protein